MPRVGSGWTDTGESFDTRGLKKRARKATRPVPIPPVLVRLVREHIKEFGTAEDGRLFRDAQGGHLLSKEYGEVWKAARLAVLTESEAASLLADVPYSLRHAGVRLLRRLARPLRPGREPHEFLINTDLQLFRMKEAL